MKKINLFLSALTLCSLVSFSGCGTSDSTPNVSSSIVAANIVEYKFTVKSISGDRIGDVTIEIYKDGNYVTEVKTDLIGNAKIELQETNYTVKVVGLPKGLKCDENITIKKGQNLIQLKAEVIKEELPEDHVYKLGDVMYDFTVYDLQNNEITLSEVLKEKKGILLNFWATWCGWCIVEFPHFEDAYLNYKDDFEIIALTPDPSDTDAEIRDIILDNDLTFFVGRDENAELYYAFNDIYPKVSLPCSVFIDQYGVVHAIKGGAFTSYDDLASTIEEIIDKYL